MLTPLPFVLGAELSWEGVGVRECVEEAEEAEDFLEEKPRNNRDFVKDEEEDFLLDREVRLARAVPIERESSSGEVEMGVMVPGVDAAESAKLLRFELEALPELLRLEVSRALEDESSVGQMTWEQEKKVASSGRGSSLPSSVTRTERRGSGRGAKRMRFEEVAEEGVFVRLVWEEAEDAVDDEERLEDWM